MPPVVTCSNLPSCTAGATVQLLGSCTASDPNATVVYHVGGSPATNLTCPQPGTSLPVTVQAVYPSSLECVYGIAAAFNVTSESQPRGRGTRCKAARIQVNCCDKVAACKMLAACPCKRSRPWHGLKVPPFVPLCFPSLLPHRPWLHAASKLRLAADDNVRQHAHVLVGEPERAAGGQLLHQRSRSDTAVRGQRPPDHVCGVPSSGPSSGGVGKARLPAVPCMLLLRGTAVQPDK